MKQIGYGPSAIHIPLDLHRGNCNSAGLRCPGCMSCACSDSCRAASVRKLRNSRLGKACDNSSSACDNVALTVQRAQLQHSTSPCLGMRTRSSSRSTVHQQHVLPLCNSRAFNYKASWVWQGSTNPALHLCLGAFLIYERSLCFRCYKMSAIATAQIVAESSCVLDTILSPGKSDFSKPNLPVGTTCIKNTA